VTSRVPRLVLTIAVLLVAFTAQGSPAQAGFAPSNDEIAIAELGDQNRIATDAEGNSIVVWSDERAGSPLEIRARHVSAGGALGPVLNLNPGQRSYQPGVATMPSGRTFAAWRVEDVSKFGPTGVKGRWIEADGSLGPLITLLEGGAKADSVEIHVVIDSSGVATVSWRNQADGSKIAMRRVGPDNALSALVPQIGSGDGHEIAALPNGDTLAVWRGVGIDRNVLSTGLVVGTPEQISSTNLVADPELGFDSAGNGLAAWRAEIEEPFSVQGIRLGPTGAPVGEELLIDPKLPGGVGIEANVAADSVGNFLVTWNRQDPEGDTIVYARPVDSSGAFGGPAQPVSPDTGDGIFQQAALFSGGTAAIAWKSLTLKDSTALGRVVDPLGAPLGGVLELFGEDANEIQVAVAPAAGFAAFMISGFAGGPAPDLGVRRFLTPPACGDSTATVVQGRPTEAPLACSGLAIEGAQVVTPPRHGRTGEFDASGPTLRYTPTPGFEGTDGFTYSATNDGGSSNQATVEIKVGKDTVRPRITRFRFVQAVRKPRAKASAKVARKRIYKFILRFSEPATGRVTVEKPSRGIRKGRRCVKPRKGVSGKPCRRFRSIGAVSKKGARRSVTIVVRGKLGKRLRKGGRFRAIAIATDPARNRSKPKTLKFRTTKKRSR
jgi:hypothetical protein